MLSSPETVDVVVYSWPSASACPIVIRYVHPTVNRKTRSAAHFAAAVWSSLCIWWWSTPTKKGTRAVM